MEPQKMHPESAPVQSTARIASRNSPSEGWADSPHNPLNWPTKRKALQGSMLCYTAFVVSIATSIISPARVELEQTFGVSSTVALLPLTFYTLALGLGPLIAGPLSETIGRYPIFLFISPIGALLTLGAGFSPNIVGLCCLRFFAGLCWAPALAVGAGMIVETFKPQVRAKMVAMFIFMPFLGPGCGPLVGAFVVAGKGWRWTLWTLVFMYVPCFVLILLSSETYHAKIQKSLARKTTTSKDRSEGESSRLEKLKKFVVVELLRPLHMLVAEPIVSFLCLYIAVDFGILFSFFAAVPYTFGSVHSFDSIDNGLVFVALIIGVGFGLMTLLLLDSLLQGQRSRKSSTSMNPEARLYPAMIGSIGLPIGLFWFAWTMRVEIHWLSPAAAILVFAWANLCIFVSAFQYLSEIYPATIIASAASANSLARYTFAGVFPLFTVQMYQTLGIAWASSLLAFLSLVLMPGPWIFFRYGSYLRGRSKYT